MRLIGCKVGAVSGGVKEVFIWERKDRREKQGL